MTQISLLKTHLPRKVFHLLFWIVLTLIFIYDRKYLILKFQLTEHFIACVVFRMGLLMALVYFHLGVLIPRFFSKGKFLWYFILGLASLFLYVSFQNMYDIYLYGFVIGDLKSRDFWGAFPYNFITTLWYLALSAGLKYSLDRYAAIKKEEEPIALDRMPECGQDRVVFLKTGTKQVMTDLDAITHVKGLKDYSIVFTDDDQIIVKGSLKNAGDLLAEKKLVRVHKSYLVALDRIKTIQHNQIILDKHSIPIGRSYKKDLFSFLDLP